MYYVYILKSKLSNQIYIGSTNDLKRRFEEHNAGVEISSKRYMPWILFYYETYIDGKLARIREKRLKYNGNALRELKCRIGLSMDTNEDDGPAPLFKKKDRVHPAPLFKKKSGAGFTLLEVLIATFVLSIGVMGAFTLLQGSQSSSAFGSNQLRASYLVQEGIEIARNIRDTNLLSVHKGLGGNWDDGLNTCGAGCEADYNDTAFVAATSRLLRVDSNGWYNYDSGTTTPFKRTITITSPTADKRVVSVDVSFNRAGKVHVVTGETELYNWIIP